MNCTLLRDHAITVILLLLVLGCSDDNTVTRIDTERDAVDQAGSTASRSTFHILPDGSEISLPKNGVAAGIVAFLESDGDSAHAIISCDEIFFGDGSSEIDLERSRSQLESVAGVLKAYRRASAEIIVRSVPGPDGDKQLAQQRSRALANELIMLGVDGGKLQATGIPTADEDSDYTVAIRLIK